MIQLRPLLPVALTALMVVSPLSFTTETGLRLGLAEARAEGLFETLSTSIGRVFERERKSPPARQQNAGMSLPAKAVPTPRPRPQADPTVELIAIGLTDPESADLGGDLSVADHRQSPLLETTVTRIVARPGVSVDAALARVRILHPQIHVAVNARFEVSMLDPQAPACESSCPSAEDAPAARTTVPLRACAADVHIGLVAVRPDLNRAGFPTETVDVLDADIAMIDEPGQGLASRLVGDAENPALMPGAHLTIAPIDGSVDAFGLLARLDALAVHPLDLVVLDVAGPASDAIAQAIDALADRNVPVISPTGFGEGAMHADPAGLLEATIRLGGLKVTHPYLNVEGLALLAADGARSTAGCPGPTIVAGLH